MSCKKFCDFNMKGSWQSVYVEIENLLVILRHIFYKKTEFVIM
jgi:hypothetical protein